MIFMTETTENKKERNDKECFMMGYLVGITANERISDDKMLEMFAKNNTPEMQALVRLITEQLNEGLIEKDVAVKFLGKKFREFAKNNGLLEQL